MDATINTNYDKEINRMSETKKCTHQQQIARFQQTLLVWSSVLVSFGLFLLCWNIHLNLQIKDLRHDIENLLTRCQGKNTFSEQNYLSDDFDPRNEHDYNLKATKEAMRKIFSHYEQPAKIDDRRAPITEHLRVKRSKGSRKSGKKPNTKKPITRMLRKNKGIGVHIQAKNMKSTPIPEQAITQWSKPKKTNMFGLSQLESDGYITVPANGLYYLYSQVVFTNSPKPSMAAEIRVGPFGSETFTKCLLAHHENPYDPDQLWATCNSNGVKYLKKGDKIKLAVHPPNISVYLSDHFTYFGAFFLGF